MLNSYLVEKRGISDIPDKRNFKTFKEWGKAIRESIQLEFLEWEQLVRLLNQDLKFLEFRGRFRADIVEFKPFMEICMEIDDRVVSRNRRESINKSLSVDEKLSAIICTYCKNVRLIATGSNMI